MFDTLIGWLKKPLDWFAWLFSEIWRQAVFGVWSVWSVVLVFFGMLASFFTWIGDAIGQVVDAIAALNFGTYDLTLSDARNYLELANTFLPVSELLTFCVSYVALLGVLLLYKGLKSIKSWIWAS